MLNLYNKMVALLSKKGFPSRLPYEPLYEYAAVISSRVPRAGKPIEQLTMAASRATYDPEPFNPETVGAAGEWLRQLRRELGRNPRET